MLRIEQLREGDPFTPGARFARPRGPGQAALKCFAWSYLRGLLFSGRSLALAYVDSGSDTYHFYSRYCSVVFYRKIILRLAEVYYIKGSLRSRKYISTTAFLTFSVFRILHYVSSSFFYSPMRHPRSCRSGSRGGRSTGCGGTPNSGF